MMTKMKYTIKFMSSFKNGFKKIKKQGKDLEKLYYVINILASDGSLDAKYKDYVLNDNKRYKNCCECHIEPDWLLIYKYDHNSLILFMVETGSHSDLFI